MKLMWIFATVLTVLAVVDIIWLTFVMGPIFKAELGPLLRDSPQALPAILFYLLYAVGIIVFVVIPNQDDSWQKVFLMGCLFGLIAYATYELTNMTTLKAWTWKLVCLDMAWGAFLTGLSATAGRILYKVI